MDTKLLSSLYKNISSHVQTNTRVGFSQDGTEIILTDAKYLLILNNMDKNATQHLHGKITNPTPTPKNLRKDILNLDYSNDITELKYQSIIKDPDTQFKYALTLSQDAIKQLLAFKNDSTNIKITATRHKVSLHSSNHNLKVDLDFNVLNELKSTQPDPAIDFNIPPTALQFLLNIMQLQGKTRITLYFDSEMGACYVKNLEPPFKEFIFMLLVDNYTCNHAPFGKANLSLLSSEPSYLDYSYIKNIMDKYLNVIYVYNDLKHVYGLLITKGGAHYRFTISTHFPRETTIDLFFDLQEFLQAFKFRKDLYPDDTKASIYFADNGIKINNAITLFDARDNLSLTLMDRLVELKQQLQDITTAEHEDFEIELNLQEYKTALDNFKECDKYISFDYKNLLWLGTNLKTAYMAKATAPLYKSNNDYTLPTELVFKNDINKVIKTILNATPPCNTKFFVRDFNAYLISHTFTLQIPLDKEPYLYEIMDIMIKYKTLMQEDKTAFDLEFIYNEIHTPALNIEVLSKKTFDNK